jgi:hypothetical protein
LEILAQFVQGQVYQLGQGGPPHFHVAGFRAQAGAFAFRTAGFTPVAGEHYPVLDFIAIGLQGAEKLIEPFKVAGTFPKHLVLGLVEFMNGPVDGKSGFFSAADKLLLPGLHFLSPPGRHGAFVEGFTGIGDHQIFVNAHNAPKSFAFGTGTIGIIKAKKVETGLFKLLAIGLKAIGEKALRAGIIHLDTTDALAFKKGGLHGIGQAIFIFRIGDIGFEAVHHDLQAVFFGVPVRGFFFRTQPKNIAINHDPGKALLL